MIKTFYTTCINDLNKCNPLKLGTKEMTELENDKRQNFKGLLKAGHGSGARFTDVRKIFLKCF